MSYILQSIEISRRIFLLFLEKNGLIDVTHSDIGEIAFEKGADEFFSRNHSRLTLVMSDDAFSIFPAEFFEFENCSARDKRTIFANIFYDRRLMPQPN